VLEAVREKAIREGVTRDEPFGYPWGRASARETSPERKSSGSKSQQSKMRLTRLLENYDYHWTSSKRVVMVKQVEVKLSSAVLTTRYPCYRM
jgi:hypothetical protein